MKRYLDTTMKLALIQGAGFEEMMKTLTNSNAEVINTNGFYIYITNPPIELFKYKECFEWIKGVSYLWYEDILVTKDNYMDIDYKKITNIHPKIDEIIK